MEKCPEKPGKILVFCSKVCKKQNLNHSNRTKRQKQSRSCTEKKFRPLVLSIASPHTIWLVKKSEGYNFPIFCVFLNSEVTECSFDRL